MLEERLAMADRKSFLVFGGAVVLVAGLLATPTPALAQNNDCVDCAIDSATCSQNNTSSACTCIIRFVRGTAICFTRDFRCGGGSCDSVPPPLTKLEQVRPEIPVAPGALAKLHEKEPLLGLVLLGLIVGDKGTSAISIESYPRGTINGREGKYTHRAIFYPRGEETDFHVVLENVTDKSTVTFAGTIRDLARRITYLKISELPGSPVQRERIDWKLPD
jgi:hypothetical protein